MEYGLSNANRYTNLQDDAAMIQAAVDAAAISGEEVVVPAVNARTKRRLWEITRTIRLPSDTTLTLVGAHLRMADDACCWMLANSNAHTPLGCTKQGRQSGITIRGVGTAILDGGVYNRLTERANGKFDVPFAWQNITLMLHNVSDIRVENLRVTDQRYWAMCFQYCAGGVIRDITFDSHCNVPNQDGIDIQIGCHDFLVEGIRGCTGDDVVAMSAIHGGLSRRSDVPGLDPDIHDITVRDLQVYGVNGCALIRLLNHDGLKLYNIRIDGLTETSPWSEQDAAVAPNPDLFGIIDDTGRFLLEKKQIPGAEGYRSDAAIRIGENFWYAEHPAQPGDTWGITVSNVSTHARFAVSVCNTLYDSHFENLRLFGNGFRAAYFNNGDVKNVTFRDVTWTETCRPHPEDGEIHIDWNGTDSTGLSGFYFNGTKVRGLRVEGVTAGYGLESVFGGSGDVELTAENITALDPTTVLLEGREDVPCGGECYDLTL